MTEIVKEADFSSYEDDYRTVQLSSCHSGWDSAVLFVSFHPAYKCYFQRIEDKQVITWDMSLAELDSLSEAWQKYKDDLAAFKIEQEARQQVSHDVDPFLLLDEEVSK